MINLRPYQTEALIRVREAYKAGKRRVIVSLPTGTGKTVVFAYFPSALKMRKRLLVLAHREELLIQAQDKFRSIDSDLKVEIEQAGARASADAKVVVASVPTLARSGSRLSQLRPDDFSIIVVDEAHHAVAPSYRRIFDHFGLFVPGTSRYLVGFTTTPRRGDKQGLGEVFEEVCYARDLHEMITDGYLCPITGWRVDTDLSLDLTSTIAVADRFVSVQRPDAARLVERSAHWRDELPTDKQKELLTRKGTPVPNGLTRSSVADDRPGVGISTSTARCTLVTADSWGIRAW